MADPFTWLAGLAQAAAASAATAVGASTATAATVGAIAYGATYIATTYAVSAGLNSLARAQLPDPEGGKITRKQSRPARQYAIGGPSRFSGAYMHRETKDNYLGVVLALAEGRLHEISRVYLNDDVVEIDEDGWVLEGEDRRYGTKRVQIDWRLGLPTETHYTMEKAATLISTATPLFTTTWPTSARGDGIASLMMLCNHGSMEYFNRDFPNGEPIPSVVGQWVCYDWRDEAQDREDPSTWGPSENPVVWLIHLEWFLYGRSWTRCIEPVLGALTEEADYCDELVEKIGGTEPRYRFAGNFFSNTEPAAVRAGILAAMDGWLSTNGKGQIVLKAGRYEEPTFTITADHLDGYTWRAFQTDEEACNELIVSYVSPEHHFTEVEADPWRDEAGIIATGRVRSENLQLTWVSYPTQARRLAKRKMSRLAAPRRGQIRTGIYGLNGLGKRYIRVQNPELSSMADVVCEVMNVEVDSASGHVAFDVILADEAIDDWDPETEEGNGVVYTPRPPLDPLEPPTIDTVEVFADEFGLPRLRVTAAGPDRDDILWRIGYRVVGDAAFIESSATDLDPSTPVLLESGLVPQGSLEVIVGYQTGGGVLSWMDGADAVEVSTIAGPAAPTEVSAEVDGADVEVAWRNPGSANLHHCIVFRGLTAVFADSVAISTEQYPTGLLAMQTFTDTSPLVGDAYYWVVAYTEALDASEPGGPSMVTFGETETLALLATFTTPATDPRKVLINNLIAELKAGGIWTKLDALYVMAAADSQAARLNWINPAGASATPFNSPAFTVDRGYQGNGSTQYFQLGYGLASLTKGGVNSLMVATWVGSGGSGYSLGLTGGFTPTIRLDNGNGSTAGGLVNDSVALTFSTATAEGLTALNRSGSSAREVYRNGALQSSDTQASAGAFPAANLILLRDISSSGGGFSTHPLRAAAFGASLNGTEHAAFHAAIHTYLAAVGAA